MTISPTDIRAVADALRYTESAQNLTIAQMRRVLIVAASELEELCEGVGDD